MTRRRRAAFSRVHLLAHANPLSKDLPRLGLRNVEQYLDLVRQSLPAALQLTADPRILEAEEHPGSGGRRDDRARVRDLNDAIADPRTCAIVAANGGAWFSRILPDIDLRPLRGRSARPLMTCGFSEMTSLVNLSARSGGRGVYWLCPNYLAWKTDSIESARSAFVEFWQCLPELIDPHVRRAAAASPGNDPFQPSALSVREALHSPIRGRLISGDLPARSSGRLTGGCLSVLAALVGGTIGRKLAPRGEWLFIEDLKEEAYRVDRYLAALRLAGWFERIAGVLVGDFHTGNRDDQPGVLALLPCHLPGKRNSMSSARRAKPSAAPAIPVVATRDVGHVWPMAPVWIGREMRIERRGRNVAFFRT